MFEFTENQKDKTADICGRFGVKVLLLFGSQVGGKTHGESDIDLAFAGRRLDFDEEAAMNAELSGVFGNCRVDTVSILKASPPPPEENF